MVHDDVHKLYAVYLGGDSTPGRLSEDHEVVVVVAADLATARSQARSKWKGHARPHVDAVLQIDIVDGYRVLLVPCSDPDSVMIDATYEPEPGSLAPWTHEELFGEFS